ncbi:hypothetical protein, partial [Listeria monocytogenes]|uniref:hypothetical protein n=1 Tax=Listeria monocytogenes TaxID=1639 RepID=UPI001FAEFCE4
CIRDSAGNTLSVRPQTVPARNHALRRPRSGNAGRVAGAAGWRTHCAAAAYRYAVSAGASPVA